MPRNLFRRWTSALWPRRRETPQSSDLERIRTSWEAFGKYDPLWAIVSVPDKRGNRWDLQEFFANGAIEIQHVVNALAAAGITLPRGRALDFGCGVGRLTQALAERFDEVDGVDVAASMVAQANAYNRHGDRVRYHRSESATLPFADGTFDFVFSKIVLQHVALDLQRSYVRDFVRVARPGGLVVFQTVARATSGEGTRFETPVETPAGTYSIDMNLFPRHDVEQVLRSAGGRLLHAFQDGSAGDGFESVFYAAAADRR